MNKQETVHRYIDIDQVDPLRDAAHDRPLRYDSLGRRLRDEVLVILGTDLGLRVNELRGLKESMFRLNSGKYRFLATCRRTTPTKTSAPAVSRCG